MAMYRTCYWLVIAAVVAAARKCHRCCKCTRRPKFQKSITLVIVLLSLNPNTDHKGWVTSSTRLPREFNSAVILEKKRKTLTLHPIKASFITNKVKLWSSLLTFSLKKTACRLVGHDGGHCSGKRRKKEALQEKSSLSFELKKGQNGVWNSNSSQWEASLLDGVLHQDLKDMLRTFLWTILVYCNYRFIAKSALESNISFVGKWAFFRSSYLHKQVNDL